MFPRKTPFSRKLSIASLSTFTSLPPPPQNPPHLSLLADQCSSLPQLQQIHAQMIISARIQDNFAASRLLSFCALSEYGDLNYAIKLFNNTQVPNSFMWNTLIRAQARSSNPNEALFLYIKMRRLGVLPGKHTFPFVLKACSNLRSLESCKQVHTHVLKFRLDLDLHAVNGLIRGYSVSCNLVDARVLFDEIAERVVKKIIALDPHNHGVYVVLSNMYAETGQWADVSRLRKVMKEESIKKTPGLSLLDGD